VGFSGTFKALSDPARREILLMLKKGNMTAGDISQQFAITGATVSYHLSQLKKAGLVSETKQKNFVIYELNTSVFEEAMLWLAQFQGGTSNEHKT
jgi:DNA-binding transcriptional ArsR family regulator